MTKKQGGAREGAGRPKGRNAYGEPTQPMRIPLSLVQPVEKILHDLSSVRKSQDIKQIIPIIPDEQLQIPLFGSYVEAGFASPADDFVEEYLDLNNLLIKHKDATFFVRVAGLSMIHAGIQPDDILIVDRSIKPAHNKIVIAAIDGEVTVKRLSIKGSEVILKAENPEYPDIPVTGDLHVWGVVTSVIHQV